MSGIYRLFKRLDFDVSTWADVLNVVRLGPIATVMFSDDRLIGSRCERSAAALRPYPLAQSFLAPMHASAS